jgi:hypothetical protein
MIRKLSLALVTAAALLLAGSSAHAQGENPALQAIVAFANLLDPALIADLRAQYPSDEELASALLATLQSRGVIDDQTASDMQFAIANRVLPRATLIVFLADVANGTEPLATRDPEALEVELAVINDVEVPQADASGNLTSEDVAQVITDIAVGGDGILAEIAESYEDAITPRNAAEGAG